MKQPVLMFLFAFLALSLSTNAVSTDCGLVNLDYNNNLVIATGETGSFTINVFNRGTTTEHISASAQCNPLELRCSYSGISDSTLLAPGQRIAVRLNVEAMSASGAFDIPGEFRAGPSGSTCATSLTFHASVTQGNSTTAQPVTAWIAPVEPQNARPGDVVEFKIGVKNNENKKIFATITSKNTNPFETSTSLTASNIALLSGETKYVTVTVRLPPGTPGGVYSWIYKVDAGNCCNYDIDLPLSIQVDAPKLSVELLNVPIQDTCLAVTPGNTTSIPLILKNNEETTGPFNLLIEGSTTVKGITKVTESTLTLLQGEQKPFQVQITPQLRTPIDNYTFKVRGTYQGFVFLDKSFCFTVQGITDTNIVAPSNIVIERTRITNTLINITNAGSTRLEYALSSVPTTELNVQIQPNTFSLNPGETQVVSLGFVSNLNTPLGSQTVQLRLDTPSFSKNIGLNVTVYPTGRSGESLLKITSVEEVKLVKGIAKAFNITIENIGQIPQSNVEITLDGIPSIWYVADSTSIFPGETEEFSLLVTVPQTATDSQFFANLTARTTNGEFASQPITFTTTDVAFDFIVNQVIENRNPAGETTSVDLVVTVTNSGGATISQVTPLINDLNYIYVQTPPVISLQGGQSAQIRINLKAAQRPTNANQTVTLQFSANEGVSNSQAITIPALSIVSPSVMPQVAIILILLIGIVAILAKTQKQ